MNHEEIVRLISNYQIEELLVNLKHFLDSRPDQFTRAEILGTILRELYKQQCKLDEIPKDLMEICLSTEEIKYSFIDFIVTNPVKNPSFIYYISDQNFDYFVKICALQVNVIMIKKLSELYDRVRVNNSLEKHNLKDIHYFEHIAAPETASQFGFQFLKLGLLDCDGVRLACAAIKESKKTYSFSPIICDTLEEVKTLCNIINNEQDSSMEFPVNFISFYKMHYVSGQITAQSDGKINIIIMDSLGCDPNYDHVICADLIRLFITQFTKLNLYFSQDERLKSPSGCSVFAIDDLRHLQTTERYLPEKYESSGLWGYLADVSTKTTLEKMCEEGELSKHQNLFLCSLPFHMNRTWQSRTLFELAGDSVVNKAREKELESITRFFKHNPKTSRVENTRLEYKLKKMREKTIDFLNKHTDEECINAMKSLTVAEFEFRLVNKPRP